MTAILRRRRPRRLHRGLGRGWGQGTWTVTELLLRHVWFSGIDFLPVSAADAGDGAAVNLDKSLLATAV